MAIGSTCQWEVRANGSTTNGGGYTSGGTDYSQQDAAQLSLTDIVANGTTTLTSATGGFTAAMIGNLIHIDAPAGWYEIATYVDTNEITVDQTVAANTGITGNVGGAVIFVDAVIEALLAGHKVNVKKDAQHTMTAIISTSNDGSLASPILIEGYNTTRGDVPTGDDRPLIAAGENGITLDNYWIIENIRIAITAYSGVRLDNYAMLRNCSIFNSSTAASRYGFFHGSSFGRVESCVFQSPNGYGIRTDYFLQIYKSIMKNCKTAVVCSDPTTMVDCVLISASAVLVDAAGKSLQMKRCTLVSAPTGLSLGANSDCQIIDCIFSQIDGTAIDRTTADVNPNVFAKRCMFDDVGTKVSNVSNINEVSGSPGFTESTWTDLACADHSGPPYDLTSAAGGFSAVFSVDDLIHITDTGAGGHFVTGLYRINSVADGTLGLATDPTDGTDETGGDAVQVTDFAPTADGDAQVDTVFGDTTSKGYIGAVTPAGGGGGGGGGGAWVFGG